MIEFRNLPWSVSNHLDNADIVVRDSDDRIVANMQVDANGLRMVDIKNNAALVASAPDLLSALIAIRARCQGEWDNPELLKLGSLNTHPDDDIVQIINKVLGRIQV